MKKLFTLLLLVFLAKINAQIYSVGGISERQLYFISQSGVCHQSEYTENRSYGLQWKLLISLPIPGMSSGLPLLLPKEKTSN